MFNKKECVVMLLAGGQGSRLYTLTEKTAKPAVPFGGKYRIIDFPLSNCVNSGFDTVGVLTQYQPLVLNEYIGNGQPWDLDRASGGAVVLPPYQRSKSADWYRGTANAIYQNINFIERYDPDYVLVLSGDHIYKMNYRLMLDFHKEKNADCTIAVIDVPLEEASRFGIMNTREDGEIYEFEEKPKRPKSTKASMGIYIFGRKKLVEYLKADEADPSSAKDFGKNVIPAMLAAGEKMYAYEFTGYWKDVGTIKSLWEANMDTLGEHPVLDLYDRDWRIYSRTQANPPQFIGEDAKLTNSVVSEGCEIHGTVENSVLFGGVYVGHGAMIRDSVIMNGVRIGDKASIDYSFIDEDTVIEKGSRIGDEKEKAAGITLIGSDLTIKKEYSIPTGDMVNQAYIDDLAKKGGK
ncbi:MAG: glucose-1-phosphate adenylyltransferase [Clostridia bacterium]|nr:glucose-1-phosphate adenylyltransferase [Clostridia bacterium]